MPPFLFSRFFLFHSRKGEGELCDENARSFFLQSLGRSTEAFWKSKEAYEDGVKAGKSVEKLNVVIDLFRWYRKYGYGAGVMLRSSGCTDEYIPYRGRTENASYCPFSVGSYSDSVFLPDTTFIDSMVFAYNYTYESEYGTNPEQAKHVRQFMLGAGMFISGVFMVVINPPMLGATAGRSLCITGFSQMYLGLSNGWAEWQNRVQEVQSIESRAKNLPETN